MIWTITLCFTWPILEALLSEHEPPDRLPDRVGLYNVIWAGTAAVGYSAWGWLFEQLGRSSLYWLPLVIHGGQFLTTWPLEARHKIWESTLLATIPEGSSPVGLAPLSISNDSPGLRIYSITWPLTPLSPSPRA